MKSLFALLLLSLAASAYGIVDEGTDHQPLRDRNCRLYMIFSTDDRVRAVFHKTRLIGRIEGRVSPVPDGGYTGRLVLFSRDHKQVVRGHYTVTLIDHPYTPPGGPSGLTYLEVRRQFQGRCSDARMLKPKRRRFDFQGSDFYYPDLY